MTTTTARKNQKQKKLQRHIPSDIDVKTDLHRLEVLIEDKNTNCSSILRLKERYIILTLLLPTHQRSEVFPFLMQVVLLNTINHYTFFQLVLNR